MNNRTLLLACAWCAALGAGLPASAAESVTLTPLWELPGFKQPESVIYDAARDVLYVSNIAGELLQKDGKGYISRVSLEGKILEEKWITGLDAPKGLAIYNDKLYIADIDTLVEAGLGKGAILKKRYIASQARFLNDVAVDQTGNVYVSDMMGNAVYRLANGRFELWIADKRLASPNGLHAESDHLVVGAWGPLGKEGLTTKIPGHLKTIALADKTVASLGSGEPVGNLDGVEADGQGNYYVTDWLAGKLLHVGASGETRVLLEPGQGSADLDYIEPKDLLLIPMMNTNRLLAFKVIQPERPAGEAN